MAKSKRERQKDQRQARIEAVKAQQRAEARKRRIQIIAVVGLAFVLVAVTIGVLSSGSDNGDDVAATDSTTDSSTDPSTDVTPSTPPPLEITGTPPTTVPAAEALDPLCPNPDGSYAATYTFTKPFEGCLDLTKDYKATFVTSKGDIVVDLREDEMPNTVLQFVSLARYHYYDGTDLFRTDPSIDIIQGGSPHTQDNSDPGPGFNVVDEGGEFAEDGSTGPFDYLPGQLILARSAGPDSSGGQFFFSTGENVSNLDSQGTYLLFGDVTEGLDILKEIIGLHVEDPNSGGLGGRPSEYVIVERVEISEA